MFIYLPNGPHGEKQGVDDFLADDHVLDDVLALATPSLRDGPKADAEIDGQRSAADRLVDYARASGAEFFRDQRDEQYLAVEIDGRRQIRSMSSSDCKRWLSLLWWEHEKKAASGDIIASAINALSAFATFEGEQHPLHVRVARIGDDIWYDLGDWRAIRVHGEGWEIVERPPILFRHFRHQKPQVAPERGGDLRDLLELINIRDPRQRMLALVYLVCGLVPNVPRPIVVAHGEHGSGKSTLFGYFRSLLDPSQLRPQAAPDNLREFVQAASHNLCLFLDNVSYLPDWLSDALCRLCTGDGFTKRALYTDDDDIIYDLRGLGGINGINLVATKSDLLDRALILTLSQMDETDRRTEEECLAAFNTLKPFLLGAMFDALSAAIGTVATIDLPALPRMADFASWGCAIARHLGYSDAEFVDALGLNTAAQNETAIENSLVAQAVLRLMDEVDNWEGTPSAMLQRLADAASGHQIDTKSKAWPKNPSHLTRRLNEVAPNLSRLGIRLSSSRTGAERRIILQHTTTAVTGVIEPEDAVTAGVTSVIAVGDVVVSTASEQLQVLTAAPGGDGNDSNDGISGTSDRDWEVP